MKWRDILWNSGQKFLATPLVNTLYSLYLAIFTNIWLGRWHRQIQPIFKGRHNLPLPIVVAPLLSISQWWENSLVLKKVFLYIIPLCAFSWFWMYVCMYICFSKTIHVTIEMTIGTGRTRLTALTAALKFCWKQLQTMHPTKERNEVKSITAACT